MAEAAQGADVVVIGGAAVGAATAYFLQALSVGGLRTCVVERDPSYAHSATARSLASIRHQFSTPENIRISMFGTEFLRSAAELLAVDGEAPDLAFREHGYLFLATPAGVAELERQHALQRSLGADVVLLAPDALDAHFPWLAVDDLGAGSLGLSGEGWLDGQALMQALRRKAVSLGARVHIGAVVALEREGRRVVAARLADGTRLRADWFINAAGTGATALAASAGIALQVHARKRCVFHFRSPEVAPRCPLVIDPSGLYFRPEGQGFLCGAAPPADADPDVATDDFEVDEALWFEQLWPALARRVPGFEAARLLSSWAGHYDVHPLDHNAILGAHPDLDNLLFANGFSGHGLQQSPAVGRALAEWVLHREYRSLDLSALGWERVLQRRPLREVNVV